MQRPAPAHGERAREALTEPPVADPDDEQQSHPTVGLPDVAWISARDGSRATGDLEDQAARYHLGPPRADDQRRLPRDHRPDHPLAASATAESPAPGR